MTRFKKHILKYGQSRRHWASNLVRGAALAGLVGASGLYLQVSRAKKPADGFLFLSHDAAHLLRLLLRDTQFSSRSRVDEEILLADVDRHLAGLEAHMQREIRQLFLLLDFHPVRVMSGISAQSVESTEHPLIFLDMLRESRLGSFRVAYRFLVSIIQLHLYKYSEAWPESFHGMPEHVLAARLEYA